MKKAVPVFVLFMLVLFSALQTSHAQVQIGIQGGLSVPNLSGGNNEVSQGYGSRLAPNFGITAEFAVTDNFSIQPEINFDGQGGQRNGLQPVTSLPTSPLGGYYYASFKNMSVLNYLEIPVLAKYSFGGFGLRFDVNAGPYIGFLLNATQKTSGTSPIYLDNNGTPSGDSASFDASTGVTSSINKVNYGVAGGVGVILPVSSRADVSLDIRGLYGLTNIQKDPQDGTSHTGNLIISVGYSYELIGI
jgi:opacity protein-like surface antigen